MVTSIKIPAKFKTNKLKKVAFFGSADIPQDHPVYQQAFKIAQILAKQGKIIVNGGGPGVMEAATRGAEAADGRTVAITFYPKDMPEFEGRDENNQVDTEVQTGNYIERMFGLLSYADIFICFQGGTGTLSEWTTAWLLAHLYHGHHKPLILFGEFWFEVIETIKKHFFIDEKELSVFKIVVNQKELLQVFAELEQEIAAR